MAGNSDRPSRPPTHEALWPKDLFEKGIGWVIVARFKSAGQRVEAGVFLVDVLCLGVKWAAYESCDRQDYLDRIRGHYESLRTWTTRKRPGYLADYMPSNVRSTLALAVTASPSIAAVPRKPKSRHDASFGNWKSAAVLENTITSWPWGTPKISAAPSNDGTGPGVAPL
jgi:hypothetical protein